MGPEVNIDSIRTLKEQIEQGTGNATQLKRARNSSLNISTRVPPEVPEFVFSWDIIPEEDFDGYRTVLTTFLEAVRIRLLHESLPT